MQRVQSEVNSEILSNWVVEGMLEKKALDVVVLDLKDGHPKVLRFFYTQRPIRTATTDLCREWANTIPFGEICSASMWAY